MAAGEYVSVSSQADIEKADLALEERALDEDEAAEREELAEIYRDRGLDAGLAEQVAVALMAHDALGAHARDEIGISDVQSAQPLQAAWSSATAFSVGAALPLLVAWFVVGAAQILTVATASLVFLASPRRSGRPRRWCARAQGCGQSHVLGCHGHAPDGRGGRSVRRGLLMIEIRPAVPEDAPGMARVIVDTWYAAHAGQVTAERLAERRATWGYDESEQGWRRAIAEADSGTGLMLVATERGSGHCGCRQRSHGNRRRGGGSALCAYTPPALGDRVAGWLKPVIDQYRMLGVSRLSIAVLAANGPARQFYERMGGTESGTREDPDGLEIVYAWDLIADRSP